MLDVLARQPDTNALMAILGNPALPAQVKGSQPGSSLRGGSQSGSSPWAALIVGLLFSAPSGWHLFLRLDVVHAPGLMRHFPQVYAVLFVLLMAADESSPKGQNAREINLRKRGRNA